MWVCQIRMPSTDNKVYFDFFCACFFFTLLFSGIKRIKRGRSELYYKNRFLPLNITKFYEFATMTRIKSNSHSFFFPPGSREQFDTESVPRPLSLSCSNLFSFIQELFPRQSSLSLSSLLYPFFSSESFFTFALEAETVKKKKKKLEKILVQNILSDTRPQFFVAFLFFLPFFWKNEQKKKKKKKKKQKKQRISALLNQQQTFQRTLLEKSLNNFTTK